MILQNDFRRQWETIEEAVIQVVRRVGESGWYILGEEVEAFEAALAQYWGIAHAVGTGNAMDALEIGLRCLGFQAGDKVLTTPLSAFATTLAILRAGGIPVFVDVDQAGGIDLSQCREVLQRDRSVRFLVPVHLYGFPLDMRELKKLREEFDLRIVEDCAQAIGGMDGELPVGTAGQIAVTSFYPTKNLGTMGDGGALLTNDANVAKKARSLRNYGQSGHYVHSDLGLNSRLDELQAALLHSVFLPNLAGWTERRRTIAQAYEQSICNRLIKVLMPRSNTYAVRHLFPILVSEGKREQLREHLGARKIVSAVHYPHLITDQNALTEYKQGFEIAEEGINARQFTDCELSLPIHPFLSASEIDAVIAACNEWNP